MITPVSLWKDLEQVRAETPLVHNITNYVVMNTTANALLALGASPVMAHAREEVEEMAGLARALVINIGTLSAPWVDTMRVACRVARERNIPIVLDPVGCGATRFRTETSRRLLEEARPAIVRGNASEIRALAAGAGATKGVDSVHSPEESLNAARALCAQFGGTVTISGPTDRIVGERGSAWVRNGHPMMSRVTGTGCTATAITGAFAALNPDSFLAAAHAMILMGIAGELAAETASGPGSFQTALLDALYRVQRTDIERLWNAGSD